MKKKEIRKEIINKRDLLKNREILDEIIKDKLINTSIFKESKNIFIYLGFGSEINTIKYVEEFFNMGKRIVIPYTDSKNKIMKGVEINSLEGLVRSKFGILEPPNIEKVFNKEEIDLIIMPGVAFDEEGNRIGYGGGYYDRFLSSLKKKVPTIALAYDVQVLERVPSEDYDKKVDMIITEKRTIKSLKSK